MLVLGAQTGEARTDVRIGLSFTMRRRGRGGCETLIASSRDDLGTDHEMHRAGQHVGLERGTVFRGFPIVLHR